MTAPPLRLLILVNPNASRAAEALPLVANGSPSAITCWWWWTAKKEL